METKSESEIVSQIRSELAKYTPKTSHRIIEKVILAALGSIPWLGSFLSGIASLKTEEGAIKTDLLHKKWLEEHENKLKNLLITISEIDERFSSLGNEIESRVNNEEYLSLVRKSFKVWEESDTEEKRKYVANIITNSAGTKLCSDDVIRLFIDWLKNYHEIHFAVIRNIYKTPGLTRYEIWLELHGEDLPREDSPEADLYRFIFRELSTGGVIRQARNTTEDGRFLKQRKIKRSARIASQTMESAFEETKQYVLTGLGQQFVHYTMNELINRIEQN
ncbi:hypothetical protein [Leptospira harrisiae]|uniref:hypothetical protein n=1 Tax=Leptospira harrisiae TaxID=2023189 RepID=UPI000C2ACA34|nr:hypothetical protein [Leptospira harrisiae]PKA06425.1 hypothetical protein CH366_19175 [Leptospira harrisiae]